MFLTGEEEIEEACRKIQQEIGRQVSGCGGSCGVVLGKSGKFWLFFFFFELLINHSFLFPFLPLFFLFSLFP